MVEKALALFTLLSVLALASSQQRFEKRGNHYIAKVAIHRPPQSQSFNVDVNQQGQGQQQGYRYGSGPQQRHHPWRQGDRITKEEVVQNLAKALLARRKTLAEMEADQEKENQEKLHEYFQKQKQKNEKAPSPPPQPPPPYLKPMPRAQIRYPVNSRNMAYPVVPVQSSGQRNGNFQSNTRVTGQGGYPQQYMAAAARARVL